MKSVDRRLCIIMIVNAASSGHLTYAYMPFARDHRLSSFRP